MDQPTKSGFPNSIYITCMANYHFQNKQWTYAFSLSPEVILLSLSKGYYRFLKGFYGLADIPTIFQEKIDQTLENKHPAWQDDIIVVTKGSKQKHMDELVDVLTKLEHASYRLSKNKSELFETAVEWIGHKIDQNGIRPLQEKSLAIKDLKKPENEKELKSFMGETQYSSKDIENLSDQTDTLRQLLEKILNGIGPRNIPKHSKI